MKTDKLSKMNNLSQKTKILMKDNWDNKDRSRIRKQFIIKRIVIR